MPKLSAILNERGYVYQRTGETLEEVVDKGSRTFYWGVDPSGDSMQVGQLMGILVLRRFVEAGHKLIVLVGGGTGMIGDPSGKSAERAFPLMTLSRGMPRLCGSSSPDFSER